MNNCTLFIARTLQSKSSSSNIALGAATAAAEEFSVVVSRSPHSTILSFFEPWLLLDVPEQSLAIDDATFAASASVEGVLGSEEKGFTGATSASRGLDFAMPGFDEATTTIPAAALS